MRENDAWRGDARSPDRFEDGLGRSDARARADREAFGPDRPGAGPRGGRGRDERTSFDPYQDAPEAARRAYGFDRYGIPYDYNFAGADAERFADDPDLSDRRVRYAEGRPGRGISDRDAAPELRGERAGYGRRAAGLDYAGPRRAYDDRDFWRGRDFDRELHREAREERWDQPPPSGPSHVGRGPQGYVRSDRRLLEDVCDALLEDPILDATDVEVSAAGGEVTLSGLVHRREDKRRAEDIVEQVRGVARVQNNLRYAEPPKEARPEPEVFTTGGAELSAAVSPASGISPSTSATPEPEISPSPAAERRSR